jgi:hypothetical protein
MYVSCQIEILYPMEHEESAGEAGATTNVTIRTLRAMLAINSLVPANRDAFNDMFIRDCLLPWQPCVARVIR